METRKRGHAQFDKYIFPQEHFPVLGRELN